MSQYPSLSPSSSPESFTIKPQPRILLVAEMPPEGDPIGKSIDKIGCREALMGLLDVALPVYPVDVLVGSMEGGIASFCRIRAHALSRVGGGYAPLNLHLHLLEKALVLAPGATVVVVGGGEATIGLKLETLGSRDVIPVGSTGGAALAIWEKMFGGGQAGYAYAAALRDELVYDALFRDLLRRAYPEPMAAGPL